MFKKFILGLIVFIGATSMAFGVVDSQIERFNFETIPYEIIDGTLPFDSFLSVNNLVNAIEIERHGTSYSLYIYKVSEKEMVFNILERLDKNKYRVWNETVIEYTNNPYFSFSVKMVIKEFIQWTNPQRNLE